MQRVFISYSRRNKTFAERLARDLSDAGLDVWIDFREIHAGEMWEQEIYRGIERSEIVIACLSPDAVTSEWVQREINLAREQEKFIIPLMVLDSYAGLQKEPSLDWLLQVQFIQFEGRYEEAFPELLRALPGKRRVSVYDQIDVANIPNPFKGLEAFQQTDAPFFFGRESLIKKSLERLRADRPERFLGVVGASGSGKSSLVRAGIIPALRAGDLPGSEHWRVIIFTPGLAPVDALAQRLAPLIEDQESADVSVLLHQQPESVNNLVGMTLADAPAAARLLLVIDQFEEVFTRAGETERELFLEIVRLAAVTPNGRSLVMITMRADFFDRLGQYPELAELFEHENMVIVTEMTPQELLRSIEGPAQAVGLVYDEGLPQRILEEVRRQPGSLPLLQYALKELYMRRDGKRLTMDAYEEIGGVQRALAAHAEDIYVQMNAAEQAIMRRLLLRLVEVSESGEATRRKVARSDLEFRDVPTEAINAVLDRLTAADSRLLIASREIKASDDLSAPTTWIEVGHEALIRHWERFTGWVSENRESLRHSSEIMQAANDWLQSNRDPAYLLRGNRLIRTEVWVQTADSTALQREFIQASIAERDRREAERQEQAARELSLQRQATNRLRLFVFVLVVGLVVAVGLSVFALQNLERANIEGTRAAEALVIANENEQQARSLALSASSNRALGDGNIDLAVLLGLSANEIDNAPPQSQRTLAEVAYAPGTRRLFTPDGGDLRGAVVLAGNPGGTAGVLAVLDAHLILWDANSGEEIRRFGTNDIYEGEITSAALSPDGTRLVSADADGDLILWDVQTGDLLRRFSSFHSGAVNKVVFSPNGTRVASASADNLLALWNVADGTIHRVLEGHVGPVNDVSFNGEGTRVVSASNDGTARVWNAQSGDGMRVIDAAAGANVNILSVAFSPVRDDRFVTGDSGGIMRLWNADGGAEVLVYEGHDAAVNGVAYSPDGGMIATAGADSSIILWRAVASERSATFNEHTGPVRSVTFTPNGAGLLTAGADGTLRLWDINRAEEVRRFVGHQFNRTSVAVYASDVPRALTGAFDNTLRVWDTDTGLTIQQIRGLEARVLGVAISADGRRGLAALDNGRLHLYDLDSGERLREFAGHNAAVQTVRFLPGETQAISGASDAGLILWDLASGEIVRRYGPAAQKDDPGHIDPVFSVAINVDGTRMVSASGDRSLILWDIASGEVLVTMEGHNDTVRAVAISPAGDRAVSGSANGGVRLWDIDPDSATFGQSLVRFEGHTRAVFGVDFAPDGSAVVSVSFDGTLRLWDVNIGFEIRRYLSDGPSFRNAHFSADGRTVITGMTDGSVREWRILMNLQELIAWTVGNRYIPEPTCADRQLFNLRPPCDAEGIAPTRTPFPMPTPTVTPPPVLAPGVMARVNTDNNDSLRVRAEPDPANAGNILESLDSGVMVELLEGPLQANGYTWWRVRTESGVEGWTVERVPEDYLQTLVVD